MTQVRSAPRRLRLVLLCLLAGSPVLAVNIDPAADGSRYAWSENVGWINFQPSGPGGPGVDVSDSSLTGWAWSENAGWISLSCLNTASCGRVAYGVTNNAGTLSGYAWSENAGWINFAPAGVGVVINGCSGVFSGRAWWENAGWITFSSSGSIPYQVATSWRLSCDDGNPCTNDACQPGPGCAHPPLADGSACDDGNPCTASDVCAAGVCGGTTVVAPPETQTLRAFDKTTYIWAAALAATRYDVVRGVLDALPVGPGDDELCFDDLPDASVSDPELPGAGSGFWYLSRAENACGIGPYGNGKRGALTPPRITTTCP